MPNLRSAVLDHVNNPDYQPVKPAVIAKKLGLANDAVRELKKTIKQIVKAGELRWGPSHLVYSSQKTSPRRRDEIAVETNANGGDRQTDRKKRKVKSKPSGDSKHFTGTFRRAAGG